MPRHVLNRVQVYQVYRAARRLDKEKISFFFPPHGFFHEKRLLSTGN
jgi:hypothetical protein